jgi:hypothetical protein
LLSGRGHRWISLVVYRDSFRRWSQLLLILDVPKGEVLETPTLESAEHAEAEGNTEIIAGGITRTGTRLNALISKPSVSGFTSSFASIPTSDIGEVCG